MLEARRRLAGILAADVVGYSAMVGTNEPGTLARVRALRTDVVEPLAASHGGRLFKTTGDGFLAEFASAVQAVRCAMAIQEALRAQPEGLRLRIGVHQGEVVPDGDDLLGDGVIVAARLEPLAEPGGICISARVPEDAAGKLSIDVEDLGTPDLKNLAQPVRVYRLRPGAPEHPALALPDKPSIAVLPFRNMSGDSEQEYFADGVVEEIITALSRMGWLFVIARNSSFTFKGRSVDVKQVGRELGARYVLEGSVRKAAARVRITGQLIDTVTGAHLWADRFDGALEDIFALQDEVTISVVGAIAPKLEKAEIERAKRKPTANLDAYDYYLRGMASVYRWTEESVNEALRLFYLAIDVDGDFAAAYGMAARCYNWRALNGWVTDRAREIAEVTRLSRRAADLGRDDAIALYTAGFAIARVGGEIDAGAGLIDRALALNPNLAAAWISSGWVKVWRGEHEAALGDFSRAMRLSPLDPQTFNMQTGVAAAHFYAGRYETAASWAEKAIGEQPNFAASWRMAAASNALAGRQSEALRAVAKLGQIDPTCRISNLRERTPCRRPADLRTLADGLRLARLPE